MQILILLLYVRGELNQTLAGGCLHFYLHEKRKKRKKETKKKEKKKTAEKNNRKDKKEKQSPLLFSFITIKSFWIKNNISFNLNT